MNRYYLPEDIFIIETDTGQKCLIIVEGPYDEIYVELIDLETE